MADPADVSAALPPVAADEDSPKVAEMASNKMVVGAEERQPTAEHQSQQRQKQDQQQSDNKDGENPKNLESDADGTVEETEQPPEEPTAEVAEDSSESKRRKIEEAIPSKVPSPLANNASPPPPPPSSSPTKEAPPATIQTTTTTMAQKQPPVAALGTFDMEVGKYSSDVGLTSDEEDTPDARAGRLCSSLEGLLKVCTCTCILYVYCMYVANLYDAKCTANVCLARECTILLLLLSHCSFLPVWLVISFICHAWTN
jgi:hypothetical protein